MAISMSPAVEIARVKPRPVLTLIQKCTCVFRRNKLFFLFFWLISVLTFLLIDLFGCKDCAVEREGDCVDISATAGIEIWVWEGEILLSGCARPYRELWGSFVSVVRMLVLCYVSRLRGLRHTGTQRSDSL